MLFVLGDITWEEVTPTFEEWASMKDATKWGQLPILTTPDGVEMTQSKAILRYLGKSISHGGMPLYPDGKCINDVEAYTSETINEFDSYKIDEMIDAFEDLRALMVPTYAIEDKEQKEAVRLKLISKNGKMHELLKKLEKECGDTFIVCDYLTVADLWACMFLSFLRCGFYDGIPTDFLSEFPKLTNIIDNVKLIPQISDYLTKKASKNEYYKCLL